MEARIMKEKNAENEVIDYNPLNDLLFIGEANLGNFSSRF